MQTGEEMPTLLLLQDEWDKLPKYCLPNSCPKCDCEKLDVEFVRENTNYKTVQLVEYCRTTTLQAGFPKDTIVVTCNTCGYERYYKPLDNKK